MPAWSQSGRAGVWAWPEEPPAPAGSTSGMWAGLEAGLHLRSTGVVASLPRRRLIALVTLWWADRETGAGAKLLISPTHPRKPGPLTDNGVCSAGLGGSWQE